MDNCFFCQFRYISCIEVTERKLQSEEYAEEDPYRTVCDTSY
jgi:hypothetical protein